MSMCCIHTFLRRCNERSLQAQWWVYANERAKLPLSDRPHLLNDRGHIAWPKGRSVLWLGQDFQLPASLSGYPLKGYSAKLCLGWWAEQAQVFINDELIQEGDLFDATAKILLAHDIQGGEPFKIRLRLVSPGHDPGALVGSELRFEQLGDPNALPEPSWIADELAVVKFYLTAFSSELEEGHDYKSKLKPLCESLQNLMRYPHSFPEFQDILKQMRETLSEQWGDWIRQRQIHLLGHAHLDLAWLWPLAETWEVAERTFRSVLALQEDFPELIFTHSSPALYQGFAQSPNSQQRDLFVQIQRAIDRGWWEVAAGLWVEPDTILPSGESLVRQVLYGQRYVQEELGQRNRVAWLPDSFGFSAQLPQMLKQGGVEWFITQKMTWNDTNVFPCPLFRWQSPDGSTVLALMSAPIGKGIQPQELAKAAIEWEQATGSQDYLWLPGVGDHGGGPTREMLETVRRWQTSPCFPRLSFNRLDAYLQRLEQTINLDQLPLWTQDLYLELHRGCYTTHGDQKQWNRNLENLLQRSELWATWAEILVNCPFPHGELEEAWKRVLFNQFHDILPGSSITAVFEDANQDWQAAQDTADRILHRSLQALCDRLIPLHTLGSISIVIFNSTPRHRCEVLAIDPAQFNLLDLDLNSGQWWDSTGNPLPMQRSFTGEWLVWVPSVPGIGYTQLQWTPVLKTDTIETPAMETPVIVPPESAVILQETDNTYVLENQDLRLTIDRTTGQWQSLYSKPLQRNILKDSGNQLQGFQDQGQYWDAWNIDPHYEQYPLPAPQFINSEVLDCGPLRASVRVVYHFQYSTIEQVYSLDRDCPWITVTTEVNWQETHVLLKVAFPWDFSEVIPRCTTESACGVVERPSQPALHPPAIDWQSATAEPANPESDPWKLSDWKPAEWEIPLHRWINLSDDQSATPWGVSLLNTGKYGADVRNGQLRLSLLRSPCWPDPQSDRGLHRFTYALYPHRGSWQQSRTLEAAQVLHHPLEWRVLSDVTPQERTLPPSTTLMSLGSEALELMSFHPQRSTEGYVLRCYENQGQFTTLDLQIPCSIAPSIASIQLLDGLENTPSDRNFIPNPMPLKRVDDSPDGSFGNGKSTDVLKVNPWQIRSWGILFNTDSIHVDP